jgi:hypothetical protein
MYLVQFSDSLRITANYIELSEGTTLIEPQKRSLHGLTGETDKSKLVLNDICIEDPAQGLLFTNMPNVEFKNIKVRGSNYGILGFYSNLFYGHTAWEI